MALLALTTLVLAATLMLARWSFDQGFLDYVNSQQQQRLNRAAEELAYHYSDNGNSWDSLSDSVYDSMIDRWFPNHRRGRPKHGGRGRHNELAVEYFPPINEESPQPFLDRDDRAKGDHYISIKRKNKFKKKAPRNRPLVTPVVLFDSKGSILAGRPKRLKDMALLTVNVVSNGENIGQLQTIARVGFNSKVDSQFSEQQTKASIVIAVLCLLIASFASWWLSRMLLAPTYKMKKTIAYLVAGDYSRRIEFKRNDELGLLMNDINRLAQKLQENQRTRKRWLADISHELRTPVAILSGEIEAMLDGIRPLNEAAIDSLDHEVTRLKHLIDDLYQLSLSDIGGLRYEFKPLDFTAYVETIVGQSRCRIEAADLHLELIVQAGIMINGDTSRLEQLLVNLINNSIAYTDAPGQISFELTSSKKHAIIIFNDSAPGVSVDDIQSVFEPLFRDDQSRNRRVGGAGLGLTICRNIVQAHDGSIAAKESKFGGMEFTIKFPLHEKNKVR